MNGSFYLVIFVKLALFDSVVKEGSLLCQLTILGTCQIIAAQIKLLWLSRLLILYASPFFIQSE